MRGYYGLFNDTLYEIPNFNMGITDVKGVQSTQLEVKSWNTNSKEIEIHASNFDPSAPSNAELYKEMVEKIKTEKITEIEPLSNVYRMHLEFKLVNATTNDTVEEGSMVKDVNPRAVYFPLGLTDENEHVGRIAKTMQANFTRTYRSNTPIGVMRDHTLEKNEYVLIIKSIKVVQLEASAFSISPDKKPSNGRIGRRDNEVVIGSHPRRRPVGEFGRRPDCFRGHPSMNYSTDFYNQEKYEVIIYDSVKEGISFNPIRFDEEPRIITINVDVDLNNYLVTADKSDIEIYLEENKKPEVDDPTPLEPSEPSGDEVVVNPPEEKPGTEEPEKSETTDQKSSEGTETTDPVTEPEENLTEI